LRPPPKRTPGGTQDSEITDERLMEFVARTELRRTPGTGRIAYSNVGGGLLGLALVYRAGASSYGVLVRQRICEPLAMAQTTVLEEADVDQLAALGDAIRLGQTERYGGRRFGIGLGWIRMPGRSGMTMWHNGGTGGSAPLLASCLNEASASSCWPTIAARAIALP
jgi:Beta-lactamase